MHCARREKPIADRQEPTHVFDLIAAHVPADLRPNVLVVGSLAAAYHFRDQLLEGVRTKDADVVIQPAGAIKECTAIATRLVENGWRKRIHPQFPPGATPEGNLPAIRLAPPNTDTFFIELHAFPEFDQREMRAWVPIQLDDGWYGLPSFRFLGLTEVGRLPTDNGLSYAAPAMMALANLLSHPAVSNDIIESERLAGRNILRSAKDLGRVLALAHLSTLDEVESWGNAWDRALRARFPTEHAALAAHAGDGLRALLERPDALEDALAAVTVGLLSGKNVRMVELRGLAARVLDLALAQLARLAGA